MNTARDKRQAWVVMLVAFAAGVTATANQFKVPPALPALAAELHFDKVTGGWLMSVFSVAAILLAIPAALVLRRVGFKAMGIVAMGCVVAGSTLGATAHTTTVLLASRLIEGVSFALMAVVAPALIARWFPPDELGLPMGLWATWVPVGSVISLNLAPLLERAFGWRATWWFGALLGLVMMAIYGLIARPPRPAPAAPPQAAQADRAGSRGVLRNWFSPGNWLLGLAFATFAGPVISYNTWAPAYLSGNLAIPGPSASFSASLLFLAGIPANLLAGWLIRRWDHGHTLLVGAFTVTTALYWWAFRLTAPGIVAPYMAAIGFVSNLVPTAVFALAPATARRPELTALAMAVVNVVSNVGILLGPPLLGAFVGRGEWGLASGLLVAASAAGGLASLLAWRIAARRPAISYTPNTRSPA